MKFFHLSDLHIGLKLFNRDLMEDQVHILNRILDYAGEYQPDAVVIAGDIYDKSIPSAEAVSCFDSFLFRLTTVVPKAVIMMISGNHDSAPRLNLYRPILQNHRIHMIGQPPLSSEERMEQVTLEDEYGPVHFYLLPFVKPSMVKEVTGCDEKGNLLSYEEAVSRLISREAINTDLRNVFVSHQFYLPPQTEGSGVERADSEVVTVGNIDAVSGELLAPFDYAALGHIHKPMEVGDFRYRYCGTPLAYSVSEAGQEKGILLVELGKKGEVLVRPLPLTPLRPVRVIRGHSDEILSMASSDYVSLFLTDSSRESVDFDLWERLRAAFPNLLEVRRENRFSPDYTAAENRRESPADAYSLCLSFLGEMDEEKKDLLREILEAASEEEER